MPGDALGCLGEFARWFPQVVPGAASVRVAVERHALLAMSTKS